MMRVLAKYDIDLGDLFFLLVTVVSFVGVSLFIGFLFVARAQLHCIHTSEQWAVVGTQVDDYKKVIGFEPIYGKVAVCDQKANR